MVGFNISSVCINGKHFPVNTVEEAQTVYDMLGVYIKYASLKWNVETLQEKVQEEPIAESKPEHKPIYRPSPTTRSVGQRSSDYARRAATSIGTKFTCAQLGEKMTEMGWTTKAVEGRSRANTVRACIRDEKDFINYHDGFWGYVPIQDTRPSLLDEE